jgi:hypothetical protein
MDLKQKEKEFIEHQLRCFFRRRYLCENLKKVNAPEMVIKDAQRSYKKIVDFFKSIHMDVEAYAQTPKGMVSYLDYTVESDTYDNMSDRCGRCDNYSYLDSRRGPNSVPMGCDIHEDNNLSIVLCKEYVDTQEDFMERIQKYVHRRCSLCKHLYQVEIKSIEDLDKDRCLKECNRLKADCINFTPIEPKDNAEADNV